MKIYTNCKTWVIREDLNLMIKYKYPIYKQCDLFFKIIKMAQKCNCNWKSCQQFKNPKYVKFWER